MSDTAGQLAYGIQFLGLKKGLVRNFKFAFGLFALCDVPRNLRETEEVSIG